MTRTIDVERLEKLIRDETKPETSYFEDGWNNALRCVLQAAESGTLSPQPSDGIAPQNVLRQISDRANQINKEMREAICRGCPGGNAITILRKLCRLKAIKDTVGKTAEYEEAQPKAWIQAFAVIASIDQHARPEGCVHDFGVDEVGDIVRCQVCGVPKALLDDPHQSIREKEDE